MVALVRDTVALERRILAMVDHGNAAHRRVLERTTHQQCRQDRLPIVGHRHAAGRLEIRNLGEVLAPRSDRHGADRIHARQAGLDGPLQDELRHARLIVHRIGVRHARDGGEAAGDGRGDTGRHRLLVLLSGLAQVHVHVDQTGRDDQSAELDHRRAVGGKVGPDARHDAVLDQHVADTVDPVCRIDDASRLQQVDHCWSSVFGLRLGSGLRATGSDCKALRNCVCRLSLARPRTRHW